MVFMPKIGAQLPTGPPEPKQHFTPRELEYIRHFYQDELSLKEVAAIMRISRSTAAFFARCVHVKLGTECGGGTNALIPSVKRLIRMGIVTP